MSQIVTLPLTKGGAFRRKVYSETEHFIVHRTYEKDGYTVTHKQTLHCMNVIGNYLFPDVESAMDFARFMENLPIDWTQDLFSCYRDKKVNRQYAQLLAPYFKKRKL